MYLSDEERELLIKGLRFMYDNVSLSEAEDALALVLIERLENEE